MLLWVQIPCANTVILHLEVSRCSRQTFSLRPWAQGSWTDMCHRQLSTWSTLHHQISKCFIYLYLSMPGTLKHETRALNHVSRLLKSCSSADVMIKKLKQTNVILYFVIGFCFLKLKREDRIRSKSIFLLRYSRAVRQHKLMLVCKLCTTGVWFCQ